MMKCDLHCHTFYSFDGKSSPQKVVDSAIQKGIDCLAITDHSEIRGALEAMEYAKGKSILIIPGIEIKSKEGDILGLNVREKIPDGLSARESIERIKELGGLVVLPHPFGLFCKFKGKLKDLLSEIDGIEILNASIFSRDNKKAQEFSREHNLPFTAGSDAHLPYFIGSVYLEIPGEFLTIEEVLAKIKNREGRVFGKEINFTKKIYDHSARGFVKIFRYVSRKKG